MVDKDLRIKIKIDSETAKLDTLNSKVKTVDSSFNILDKTIRDFKDRVSLGANIFIAYETLINTIGSIGKVGFETNKTMQNLNNSLTTLRAVSASNTDSMGNQLTIQQKYNMAQQEATQTLQELIKINAQTPHSLNETGKIYDAMYMGMKKIGASSEDMIEITKKISIAAGNRMNFDALLSAMDGLSTGTVEVSSDMGRFLNSIGLSNEAIKNSSNVVQLFKDKLSGFQAIDNFDTRISNLNNNFETLAGTLTKPFFDDFSNSMIPATELLSNLNIKLVDYYNNINKVQDIHKQNNVVTLKDELGELEKRLDSTKEASKRFYNQWTTNDEAEINKLELLIKTTKNKIKDLENPANPKLVDKKVERSDSDIIKIMGTDYQKLNLEINDNVKKLKESGATQLEVDKYKADSIKDFNEKQSKLNEKTFKEKEKQAEESAKKIAEVEAEFNLIGLNEWDTKFKELDNKYNADLVKYAGVVGAKTKIDLVYEDNKKNLANQKEIAVQKEDLSYYERKIQLQDDSLSKELELQGISYSSRVLEIENTTKSIAEKDKLIAKETELFNLTVQNMNYKYDTEFQDTMNNFYDDMLDSQLALNNAVYDFGSGFDGVSSKIGNVSKSIAAMSSLELTNKKEASKLDKKYIEQFNKYAGDVEKTKELEQQYTKDTAILNEQNIQAQLNGYANIAGSMSSMFEEGSREAASFQLIEASLALSSGIRAILTQGSGDPYTAFARMAAMAATVSSMLGNIGIAFGMNTTTTTSDSFSSLTANDGSGSVLGDSKKQSESITNALSTLENFAKPEYQTLLSMNSYLETIASNIGGVASLLIQGEDYALGSGFVGFDTGYSNNLGTNNTMATLLGGAGTLAGFGAAGGFGAIGGLSVLGPAGLALMGIDKLLLGGMLTNTIGGLFNSVLGGVFGKTKVTQSLTDSGIYFADTLLTSAIDQFDGEAYQTISTTTTKKSWFSKSSKTSVSSYFEDLDSETERQFTLVLDGLYNTALVAGEALDSASLTTADALSNFVISIGKVSLKDLTGDEIQEKLTNIFSEISDDIAVTAFPLLTSFQQVGEGMFETLTRVATGMEEAEYYIARLGNSFADITYTAIENAQGDVGFEALRQSIDAFDEATYGANNNLVKIIDSLDATAEELYTIYTTLDELRDRLIFLGQSSQGISSSMIYGAGSVDSLSSGFSSYFENFLSESEQLDYKTQQLSSSFASLGILMPTTNLAFKELLSGLDLTSTSGQELYGRLITLSDSFADISSSKVSLLTNQLDSTNSSISSLEDISTNLESVISSLRSSIDTSSSSSLDKFARSMTTSLLLAQTGDYTSLANSVKDTISYSNALNNSDYFTSARDMQYAQAVAANQFESMNLNLDTELSVLQEIADNTNNMIAALSNLTTAVNALQESSSATANNTSISRYVS